MATGRSKPLLKIPGASLAYHAYYTSRFAEPLWSVLNRQGRALRPEVPVQGEVASRAVDDLMRSGIAIVEYDALVPEGPSFARLAGVGETFVDSPEVRSKLRLAGEQGVQALKSYLLTLWDLAPVQVREPFLSLSLSPTLLSVVASYLGLAPRLMYVDLWYSLPTSGPAILSQRWHRDPEDRRIVKTFLYLRDVGEGSGPLSYVPGTHDRGPHRSVFPRRPPHSSYPEDGLVEQRFAEAERLTCAARAGTVVLCDTTGLHKGGYATDAPRYLYHAMYTSNAALPMAWKSRNFDPTDVRAALASGAARYAVGPRRE